MATTAGMKPAKPVFTGRARIPAPNRFPRDEKGDGNNLSFLRFLHMCEIPPPNKRDFQGTSFVYDLRCAGPLPGKGPLERGRRTTLWKRIILLNITMMLCL